MANEQTLPEPITRDEKYLAAAAGMEVETPEPITRVEKYLSAIAEGAGGDSYTKAETDALLEDKADLDNDGLVPLSQIPPAAMEHMKTVTNDTARFALTKSDVQNGDTVYVDSSQQMYMVVDDDHLDSETGYKPYAAGTASRAIADKNGNDITNEYQTKVLGSWTAGSATSHSTPDGTDTVLEALQKIDNNQRNDETNISLCKQFTDNATIDSDRKLYISATEPTGNIPVDSTWIAGNSVKSYSRTNNLFNNFDIIGKVPSINTGNLVDYDGATCTPIPITDGNITLTKPSTDNIYIYLFLYTNNMTFIGYGQVSGNNTTINGNTITGYENAKYFRIRIDRNNELDINIMVNIGSSSEEYVPYLQWQ